MRVVKRELLKVLTIGVVWLAWTSFLLGAVDDGPQPGQMLGAGGGGAMSGFSSSPYNDLWFVGTDMGILFRSENRGASWQAIDQFQTWYDTDLSQSAPVGFSSDGETVFHAPGGQNPVRSTDGGVTWKSIPLPVERVRYFIGSVKHPGKVFAFTDNGVWFSLDKGLSWENSRGVEGEQLGSFLDEAFSPEHVYTATREGVYRSTDGGGHFARIHEASIIRFTGGRDPSGLTLAYLERDASDCPFSCGGNFGYVYVNTGEGFHQTSQYGGKWLTMAQNDAHTIYVTGDREWESAYGTKVWKSTDKGKNWEMVFLQLDWDHGFTPWPSDQLEYSGVGLDVGWWDEGYYWFSANQLDSSLIGGSGNFFLHVSEDGGTHWRSPFTSFAGEEPREAGKNWSSTGLEVTTVRWIKWHPSDPAVGYASVADIGGLVTEDRGKSWRIINTLQLNTFYDFAFDPAHRERVYAVAGSIHGFPGWWHGSMTDCRGGIFQSDDLGRTWQRITPEGNPWNRQFLSIAYDWEQDILYAGSQSIGVATRQGGTWSWDNKGLGSPESGKIIPVIKIDPHTSDVYCLLAGDKPEYTNAAFTGVYRKAFGEEGWTLLRGKVHYPPDAPEGYDLWVYPVHFDIDFSTGTLFLVDMESPGQWLTTGVWKSEDMGKNWHRKLQHTHAYHVQIDPFDPHWVTASGPYVEDWGNGGAYFSRDGGETWQKDLRMPIQFCPFSIIPDPLDATNAYYTYYGGGILYQEKP